MDDVIQQLDLLAITMKTSGSSVVTGSTPIEAISRINEHGLREIDVAVGMPKVREVPAAVRSD